MDEQTDTWRDAGGVEHDRREAERHRRIVSLVPSLTETICAVGGRSRLVGCTAFCTRPPDLLKAADVVTLGGTKTVMRERLLALNPNLVLLNLEENRLEDIEFFKSRVECYINGVKTVEDGIATIRELGALISDCSAGFQPAVVLAQEATAVLQRIKQEAAGRQSPRKIFYAIWREPWMSVNRDTFIHSQLSLCGAQNVFADAPQRYPEVTLGQIRAEAPDMIWLPSEPYRFKQKHVDELRRELAFTGRIELVDGDNVCWFGARQIEGMAYTRRMLTEVSSFRFPVSG